MTIANFDATTGELLIAFDLGVHCEHFGQLLSVDRIAKLAAVEVVDHATKAYEVEKIASHRRASPRCSCVHEIPPEICNSANNNFKI